MSACFASCSGSIVRVWDVAPGSPSASITLSGEYKPHGKTTVNALRWTLHSRLLPQYF